MNGKISDDLLRGSLDVLQRSGQGSEPVDDKSPDELFAIAVHAYKKRDPRLLSQFVIDHDLTAEQREFVAKALVGDIEQQDGRKVKPTTEVIMAYYFMLRSYTEFASLYATGEINVNKSEIAGYIAHKLNYDDEESVRRTINRQLAKMKAAPVSTMRVLETPGHEKK